jgi:ecotin
LSSVSAITTLSLFAAVAFAQAADVMKAFPPAEDGMVRYVLKLPEQDDESVFKVELIVGKTVQVDEKNRYFFGGKIEKEFIKGWGYTRYYVSKFGPMAGTRIAVDPNAPKIERFITLGGEPYFIRYNSRMPIVVYVPEDVEVRYRIWTTDEESQAMQKEKQATVSGTVYYLQRIALPPGASVEVKLVDISKQDVPAVTIAEKRITNPGQVPIPFELHYDPAKIDFGMTYAVQARIEQGGRLLFISTRVFPVITRGNPIHVEVKVDPVK